MAAFFYSMTWLETFSAAEVSFSTLMIKICYIFLILPFQAYAEVRAKLIPTYAIGK